MAQGLLIVGAGPKAAAIVAKAWVLSNLGFDVPEITVLDSSNRAAHWDGRHGYTDGFQPLGTPPEKDIGYPYNGSFFGNDVSTKLFAEFSWNAYLSTLQRLGDWVDRGKKHPAHSKWASYVDWCFNKSNATIVHGHLKTIVPGRKAWTVSYESSGKRAQHEQFNGIVITGPGPAKQLGDSASITSERLLDGKNFWNSYNKLDALLDSGEEPVVILGSGETAGTIAVKLLEIIGKKEIPVFIVNRHGFIYSRGESYFENRIFTESLMWKNLPEDHRRNFISRTDRGVISQDAISILEKHEYVISLPFDADRIQITQGRHGIQSERMEIFDRYNNSIVAQCVVLALGFDPWWFVSLIDSKSQLRLILQDKNTQKAIERLITRELALPGMPMLHLPMLAGLAQGPGFPNLSCLGTLSDRILEPYVSRQKRP